MKLSKLSILIYSVFFVLILTVWNFDNSKAFGNILNFVSIMIGFNVTALSIIGTTSLASKLYKLELKENNSKTMLHDLIDSFMGSIYLFSIVAILIYLDSFIGEKPVPLWRNVVSIKGYEISLLKILHSLIWTISITSFFEFFKTLKTTKDYIIQNAKVT